MLLALVVSVVAEVAKAVPFTVIASASKVPSISASPEISRLAAVTTPTVIAGVPDNPVALPVKAPAKPVAVNTPEEELKVKFVPDLGAKLPVAAVENKGKQVVSLDSSATVIVVAIAAVPVVS